MRDKMFQSTIKTEIKMNNAETPPMRRKVKKMIKKISKRRKELLFNSTMTNLHFDKESQKKNCWKP
jgi:hypothetical protein